MKEKLRNDIHKLICSFSHEFNQEELSTLLGEMITHSLIHLSGEKIVWKLTGTIEGKDRILLGIKKLQDIPEDNGDLKSPESIVKEILKRILH